MPGPEDNIRTTFDKTIREQPSRLPVSTYRLQFNSSFRFRDARDIAEYLSGLGITDVYSSPYFRARRGSDHGYDVTDPTEINPELGTEEEFTEFSSHLNELGMGLIMDVVPNHMGVVVGENPWWTDVLENGRSSPYARFFDIDWNPVRDELVGKVLIPILGGQYGDLLEGGDLRLSFDDGAFHVNYYEHRFPIDPSTYTGILGLSAESMNETVGEEDESYLELMSIITSVKNLPHRNERNPEKTAERLREKEVVKRRLQSLFESSQDFRVQLQEAVRTLNGTPGKPESFDPLDELLNEQVYRLSFWQVATEEINYRRFFDINDLAAIRAEDPSVFGRAHEMLLRHVGEGLITGLRIDHPDGLFNPRAYFTRLQEECFIRLCSLRSGIKERDERTDEEIRGYLYETLDIDPSFSRPFYIVGEKILMESEKLPSDWPIYGTTGYSFMNSSGGVLVDSHNVQAFTSTYNRFIREKINYPQMVYHKKRLILETSMAGETNMLGHRLNRISEGHRRYRDFTLNSLTDAITETIAHFPVYRTYITGNDIPERDVRYIEAAINKARRERSDLSPSVFDFLHDVLTLRYPEWSDEEYRAMWLDFAMSFQQMTGPVMAKGLEDTTFYCYNRLISLNEVGGTPSAFGLRLEAFHGQNIERSKHWPLTMVATSTHDAKRSEDVRARIHVLSELPDEWYRRLKQWSALTRRSKKRIHGHPTPDRNDEYLLYQTLLGAWPHGDPGVREMEVFQERIRQYMLKAVRESKRRTNWISPDVEYEDALMHFIDRLFENREFLSSFLPFQEKLSFYGIFNSLSLVLMKSTAPGVPDFYQGSELWNLTLVDPDNRRQVDYESRRALLEELNAKEEQSGQRELVKELLATPEDARIKLFLTSRALRFRQQMQEVFNSGEYIPLYARGSFKRNVVAFERKKNETSVISVCPRILTDVVQPGQLPVGTVWQDTSLPVSGNGPRLFRDIFSGTILETEEIEGVHTLPVSLIFGSFPCALLEDITGR